MLPLDHCPAREKESVTTLSLRIDSWKI
ncbi:hypothetical protein SPHINGOR109_50752 [Sphingorhabdus sp. 109]|nr:hypothetical protein SPHINGOR109_50752 [Sphingorhabdus sp. 109]